MYSISTLPIMVYVFANFLVSLLKRKSFSAHRSERHTAFSSNDHETLATSLNSGVSFSSSGKWDDNHSSYLLGFSREMKELAHVNRSENSAGHADSTTHWTFNPPGTNCWLWRGALVSLVPLWWARLPAPPLLLLLGSPITLAPSPVCALRSHC